MSREIKFRAWDKLTKQIFKVKQIDFDAIERNVYGFITSKSILGGVYESLAFRSFDNIELMQFTGLKDCNGTEIYEGDIVKYASDFYEVKFIDGAFCLKHIKDNTFFLSFFEDTKTAGICIIVGNIYEKHKLLGGKND